MPRTYLDAVGIPTIGWGHVILPGEVFIEPIDKDTTGTDLLVNDVKKAERAVARLIKVPISINQFSALTSFVFNCGGGVLQNSTLRSKLNRQEYRDAAEEFNRFIYAKGKKLNGLIKRRRDECNLFLRDVK